MNMIDIAEEISRCNRCGFCQTACPIFRSTGHEGGVARGRLALLSAIVDASLDWDAEIEDLLFTCLLCGACTTNCFSAVPTADMLVAARRQFLERVGKKPGHRLLFDHLLPFPNRLRLAVRAASMTQKANLPNLVQALGLLRFLGQSFPLVLEMLGRKMRTALRDRLKPQVLDGQGEHLHIAYFCGCGIDLVQPEAGLATLEFLKRIGQTVEILPNCCCGLPAETYGDLPATQRMAEKNLALMTSRPYDLIVTDCSSCASFLKKYPLVFQEDDPRHESARLVSNLVQDFVQVAAKYVPLPEAKTEPIVATYHDPCHAVRSQNLVSQPRVVLKSIRGLQYRELHEADWCCGGAGSYSLRHYDLAQKVMVRKADNISKTKAQVVTTSCPSCLVHLDYACRRRGLSVKTAHISQIIMGDERIGRSYNSIGQ
jgi:glycolate oxidase iron-sulfur subunit